MSFVFLGTLNSSSWFIQSNLPYLMQFTNIQRTRAWGVKVLLLFGICPKYSVKFQWKWFAIMAASAICAAFNGAIIFGILLFIVSTDLSATGSVMSAAVGFISSMLVLFLVETKQWQDRKNSLWDLLMSPRESGWRKIAFEDCSGPPLIILQRRGSLGLMENANDEYRSHWNRF